MSEAGLFNEGLRAHSDCIRLQLEIDRLLAREGEMRRATLEEAEDVCSGWLDRFTGETITHIPAEVFAADAVRDIRDGIRALKKSHGASAALPPSPAKCAEAGKESERMAAEIYEKCGAFLGEDCGWEFLGPEEQAEQLAIFDIYAAVIAANSEPNHRTTTETDVTEAQIKRMVDRFLGWRLPENFNPDCGISFKKTHSETGPFGPQKYEPTGTNLFDAEQATAMVRHMVEGS